VTTKIARVRCVDVGFSRSPATLKRNLVTNASLFEDFDTKPGGWFGPVVCTIVEVESEDGAVGIGSAGAFHNGARSLIETYYTDLVVGEDLRRHEHLWQRMYRTTARFGRSGSAVAALSAIDIACWDLHGKAEGKPVHELLGGAAQTRVPAYASRCYAMEDLDALAAEARGYVAQGFRRLKQRFGFGPRQGPEGMQRNVALVRAVRDAVGMEVELAADAYMGWDVGYAMEMAKLLREYRLSWIEEPLMPHDVDGYVELKLRCPWQRWSCGEHSYTKWDFQELIARRAVDMLQPDANRAGGITELRKICAMAEAVGLPVIPHSNEPHNLAITFSQPAHVCPVIEYFPDVEPDTGNELFWRLYTDVPQARDGYLDLDTQPGLGVDLDHDAVHRLAYSAPPSATAG